MIFFINGEMYTGVPGLIYSFCFILAKFHFMIVKFVHVEFTIFDFLQKTTREI
jgi:hypothetical protein